MSLENAINDHALALRELAAAIRETVGRASALSIGGNVTHLTALPADAPREVKGTITEVEKFNGGGENEPARVEPEETQTRATPREELKEAIDAASANKVDETDAASANKVDETDAARGIEGVAESLHYAKDVRPALLAAIKRGKRAEIEAHLAAAGVKKADELPASAWPELLAYAQKLVA